MESLTGMDVSGRAGDNGEGNESLGDSIVEEMESFLIDINERLTISRMVSDSVIKGMVNAIEQEAAERISQKETEVVGLKEKLHIYHVGADETITLGSSVVHHEPGKANSDHLFDTVVEHDRLLEPVERIQIAVDEQLKQLKEEINKIRGDSSVRRISSGSELVGLDGILPEKVPERRIYVDGTFESLAATLETFYRGTEVIAQFSKASLSEWQQEQEFRSEIEEMVINYCIRSSHEEFEQKLWDQNAQIYRSDSGNWFDNLKEISCLRQELDIISKALSVSETGQLHSHGSFENGEEWCNNKRSDHFHWKPATNHLSTSIVEGNGKHEDSNKPENSDSSTLKHMSKDELIAHYNSEITNIKRNHECQVQEMTEEIFRLRRELYREKGSSLPLKKDKDFDMLRKRFSDVITKLDTVFVRNEKVLSFSKNIESLSSLKDSLESLHTENHQLRDMLVDKKKEIKCLSSQLSDAVEKLSQQQLTKKNLLQIINKLEGDVGDSHAEISVIQDVYKCVLKDITDEFRCITEESHLKYTIMEEVFEVLLKEAAYDAQSSNRPDFEDADMESLLMQGLLDFLYKEALMDANRETLKLESAEIKKLEQEILRLTSLVEEKNKLAQEAAGALIQEKKMVELASEELNSLRAKTDHQQNIILESNKELEVTKGELVEAWKKVEQYKEKMLELHQNLEQRTNKLREIDEERRILHAASQEQQDALTLIFEKERETRKQMESTIALAHKLFTAFVNFESRVNEDISRNCLRIGNISSEFHWLNNKVNILKTVGLVYKQRLEIKCSDLVKAEAEVDLLGDEVDSLLSLLEKIYIALDHYSPILRHYPGEVFFGPNFRKAKITTSPSYKGFFKP
ncbi:WPP domain-associated protein [Senna tora]|uniref:WPP domain-associated protein n=1 Tax=Senna tora TaxID=362788 RepID=A0A834XFU3_9FABA|nr:WPP domain-associated protein [Senna tora]